MASITSYDRSSGTQKCQSRFPADLLTLFVDLLQTNHFMSQFTLENSKTSEIMKWIFEQNSDICKEIVKKMLPKIAQRERKKSNSKTTTLRTIFKDGPVALRELGTEKSIQVFKAAAAVTMYGKSDKRILEMYRSLFATGKIGPSLLVGTKYVPSKCNKYKKNRHTPFEVRVPKSFEVLMYFHALQFLSRRGRDKRKDTKGRGRGGYKVCTSSGNRVGFLVQLIVKAWSSLARNINIGNCEELVSPYLFYDNKMQQFRSLETRQEGFTPKTMRETFEGSDTPAVEEEHVDAVAWRRNGQADTAFRYVTAMFLTKLHLLLSNGYLFDCEQEHDMVDLKHYTYKKGAVAPLFKSLPDYVKIGIGYSENEGDVIDVDISEEGRKTDVTTTDGNGAEVEKEDNGTGGQTLGKRKRDNSAADLQIQRRRLTPGARFLKNEDIFVSGIPNKPRTNPALSTATVSTATTRSQSEKNDLQNKLLTILEPYCRMYDTGLDSLMDTYETVTGSDLEGTVQLIAVDPPYTSRRSRQAKNSSHDELTTEDMQHCVTLFSRLLKPGGHGIIFCSPLQFAEWHGLLTKMRETQVSDDDEDDDDHHYHEEGMNVGEQEGEGEKVFNVEDIALTFVRAPGHYTQNPCQKRIGHMSVTEMAVHFWKRGLPFQQELDAIDYSNQGYVPSRHTAWTNCIDDIPRLCIDERVTLDLEPSKSEENLLRPSLRPEQKNIAVLQELIARYTKPGDLVVDVFGGTFSTAKACLSLEKHRRFVGCEIDENCLERALPTVLKTFARQLKNEHSDITGSEDDIKTAMLYLSHLKTTMRESAKFSSGWDTPPGLPMYQRLPIHVHRYLSCVGNDIELSVKRKNEAPGCWNRKQMALLNTVDVTAVMSIEAAAKGFVVCKSTIQHPGAGRGVFAMRPFQKGSELLTYYGTLVYKNISSTKATTKVYGNGVLGFRKRRFTQTALQLHKQATDEEQKRHPVFIVPAPFCVAGYINDARYLENDKDMKERRTTDERKPNVCFTEKFIGNSMKAFTSHNRSSSRH